MSLSQLTDCPFCGHKLTHTADGSHCDHCKATDHPPYEAAKHTPESIEQTMERIHAPDLAAERDRLLEKFGIIERMCFVEPAHVV